MRFTLVYSIVSVVFFLAIAETCFRVFGEPNDILRESRFWTADKYLGWANRPNFEDTFSSRAKHFSAAVKFDDRGLRPTGEADGATPQWKILLIGDSTTVGMEVDQADTYAARLERKFQRAGKRVKVYNAAVRGYGTDQSFLRLQQLLPVIRPDIVIYMATDYAMQSLFVIKNWYRHFAKPAFALNGNQLTLVNSPVEAMEEDDYAYVVYQGQGYQVLRGTAKSSGVARWLRNHSFFYGWLDQHYLSSMVAPQPLPPKAINKEIFSQVVVKMQRAAPRFFMTAFYANGAGGVPAYETLRAIAEKSHVSFLDIRPFFKSDAQDVFVSDGHWNRLGHAEAATGIFQLLSAQLH